MEITKKYIAGLMGIVQAEYPKEFANVKEKDLLLKIEMWYRSLAKYPKEVVDIAFQKALESSPYPPKLADIMNGIGDLKKANEKTDAELWDELVKALMYVDDITYFGMREFFRGYEIINPANEIKKTFEALDPMLQEYLGSAGRMVDLSKQDTLEFEKGRFLKMLPTLKNRAEVRRTIDPEILQLLNSATKSIESAGSMLLTGAEQEKMQ